MYIKMLILAAYGISFGLLSSAGVFTVLATVGLVPRFAGKTHTARNTMLLENMVILGTLFGGFASVFDTWIPVGFCNLTIGRFLLGVSGVFAGMFVGCLALAIAEMLNSIPIFARRVGFHRGLRVAVAAAALGKVCGSLFYFFFCDMISS